jgi:hypothetical protein
MANTPLATMLLDPATWDLTLDADGNIALNSAPGSLAQDAASAIQTFLGECFWDTAIGIPWLQTIISPPPPQPPPSLAYIKQQCQNAALTVPGVAAAQVYISSFNDRAIQGQVQVVSSTTGQTSAADFSASNPQGGG